jgi:uncharacterized protein YjbJ (UPF0337 family)
MSEERKVKTHRKNSDLYTFWGEEPSVTSLSTDHEMGKAYNWYNAIYSTDDSIKFTISYLKSIKYDKEIIQKLTKVKPFHFNQWIGWNCRLMESGSTLPEGTWDRIEGRIKELVGDVQPDEPTDTEEEQPEATKAKVISIQERVAHKAYELIGELEEQLDTFYTEGVIQFDVKKWTLEKSIKPQIAKRIIDHFRPQYEEITLALSGSDAELTESYRGWRKPILKVMALFIKRIVDHMIELESAGAVTRKPRKKKVKPASVLVAKLKYKEKDGDLVSVNPTEIIGASQAWVYNTKYRSLSVYNAVGNSGLSVRGTTITGFDPESSVTKKLRKPESVIKPLLEGGKVYLRKLMETIKTTEQKATGRVNAECILLRMVK